jgi:hypothetical protein
MRPLRALIARARAALTEDPWAARAVLVYAAVQAVAATWDLPSSWSWEVDAVAPRELYAGLADNLVPGARHRYPLLQYVLIAVPSVPFLALGLFTAPELSPAALEAELIRVPVMTGVSAVSKALTIVMGCVALLALARIARRTVSTEAGRWAIAFAALNLSFGYYGRTNNLDVPYLMWTALAVDRLLSIAERGERRDYFAFALFVGAAVGTKDQAYASIVLLGLVYLVVRPALRVPFPGGPRPHWKWLGQAVGVGALALGLLGGGLLNPLGFVRRFQTLIGPASRDFRVYEASWTGFGANLTDLAASQAEFWWPWPVVLVAWAGVVLAAALPSQGGLRSRGWRLVPAVAAISSLLFFTLVVGRCEHRFALPLGFWLSLYAGLAVAEALHCARPELARQSILTAAAALLVVSVARPVALVLTQLGDARKRVEAYLDALPVGSRVEAWGRLPYLPRFESGGPYRVTHVHPDKPPKRRPPITGAIRIQAPYPDVLERAPDALVLPGAFVSKRLRDPLAAGEKTSKHIQRYLEDAEVVRMTEQATTGGLPGYDLALVAQPRLPAWARVLGLEPIEIHGSTGRPVWVLRRRAGTERGGGAQ